VLPLVRATVAQGAAASAWGCVRTWVGAEG